MLSFYMVTQLETTLSVNTWESESDLERSFPEHFAISYEHELSDANVMIM